MTNNVAQIKAELFETFGSGEKDGRWFNVYRHVLQVKQIELLVTHEIEVRKVPNAIVLGHG